MRLFNIFNRKRNVRNIQVTTRKQNMLHEAAAAVAFSDEGEHEMARSLIDKNKGNRTILMIVNGNSCSRHLNEYALEMAQRLGYKLLALHVTEMPHALPEEKRDAALAAFRESCMDNVKSMRRSAENMGVSVSHVIECGPPDDVVAKLHAQYPGMRYVLTEPDPEIVSSGDGRTEIPVFDLGSFQPSAA